MEHLDKSERIKASMALLVAVVLFASAFVAIRSLAAAGSYAPTQIVDLRMLVASACLGVIVLFNRGLRVPRGRDWIPFIALGAGGQTLYQLLLTHGERTVDSGTAALLVSTAPVLAAVLAVAFLGERLTWIGWAGTATAFLGAALIASSSGVSLHGGRGVVLVVVATLLWATYQVVQKTVAGRYGALELTAWPTWIAALVLLPTTGGLSSAVASAPVSATLATVWLGAASSVGGFLAWSYAVRRLPVVVSSNALFGVPLATAVIAFAFLHESPHPAAFAGGAIVVAGVALAQAKGRPAPSAKALEGA